MIQYLQLSLFDVMPDAEIGMIGMIYIAHTVFPVISSKLTLERQIFIIVMIAEKRVL